MPNIKDSSIVKKTLRFPGVFSTYHFLWAWTGAKLHRYPGQKIFAIGVTGTKGKTTTLELLNAILEGAGKRTALLSSVRVKIGEQSEKNRMGNSMPGHGYVQQFLKKAIAAKCGYALIEVTSQGVVAHRHRFVDWNMGVLTNLAPEHIDSHGSFENYRNAKLGFLKYVLDKGGKVFLNRDDVNFSFFAEILAQQKIAEYSKSDAWLKEYLPKLTPMHAAYGGPEVPPKFLIQGFNEENIAVAVAIAKDLGIGNQIIERAIANFKGVPGRMEFVRVNGYTAIADYAHTPDSLEAAYEALRAQLPDPKPETRNPKLICVLSAAGGGRDRWKRPEMGKIAAHYCDEIIVTNEDPYDEDPQAIMNEIAAGITSVPYPRPNFSLEPDRRVAIEKAIEMMGLQDFVIATGKGSEEWIHLAKGKKIPWNEREILEQVLTEKKNGPDSVRN